MIPTVGRIVHVPEPERCVAAIITDVQCSHAATRDGHPSRDCASPDVSLTVFTPHGPYPEAARRLAPMVDRSAWHDPRECPFGA